MKNHIKPPVVLLVTCLSLCLTSHVKSIDAADAKSFKMLAILPLENLGSSSRETDSIGQEMAISLMQSLSQVRELSVMDPASIRRQLMQKMEFVQAMGIGDEESLKKQLAKAEMTDIDYFVLGTYRIIGSQIKVTIRMVDHARGEVKITPLVFQDRYPDNLFMLEKDISERAASAISAAFESYYKDFDLYYAFTKNREAYRLYLMGIDAKSDQTVQGYAKAVRYFYDSYREDNSFMLPLMELSNIRTELVKNYLRIVELATAAGISSTDAYMNTMMSFSGDKGMLSRINLSATRMGERYRANNPVLYANAYARYTQSPYYERYKNASRDMDNFPNDITTLFAAWEKIDGFKTESMYRKKIIEINPHFIPLSVVDAYAEIIAQQESVLKEFKILNDEQAARASGSIEDNSQSWSERYDAVLAGLEGGLKSFMKRTREFDGENPGARYATVYLNLFTKIYCGYLFNILMIRSGKGVDFDLDKELGTLTGYYNQYIAILNEELGKITIQ
jgi:TolB-like protein